MKPLVLFFSLIFFSACSSVQETAGITLPELIYQHPLPAFSKPLPASHLKIGLKIFVAENGTVRDVELLNSSGNLSWDTSAEETIRHWRYSPARYNGKAISIWLKQTAIVQFSDPFYLSLGEIIFSDEATADSAFALLEEGADFSEIVQKFSVASSRSHDGSLGTVNVQIFPEQIKKVLVRLDRNAYTSPIKFGEQYAIFKRLKE